MCFLRYAPQHRGYLCLDVSTNRLYTSRHVTFDENVFSLKSANGTSTLSFDDFNHFLTHMLPSLPIIQPPVLSRVPSPPSFHIAPVLSHSHFVPTSIALPIPISISHSPPSLVQTYLLSHPHTSSIIPTVNAPDILPIHHMTT